MRKAAPSKFCEVHPVFLAVASETIERIRYDKKQAPNRIRPLLAYIERRLFDPQLNANRIYQACDVRDRSMGTFFRDKVGSPPWKYIEERRIEVGEKLTRLTRIRIQWIGSLLGYSSLKVFSGAFRRQIGERPMPYRKKFRTQEVHQLEEDGLPDELAMLVKLRRALNGRLDLAEADRVVRRLFALYPELTASGAHSLHTVNPAIRRYLL